MFPLIYLIGKLVHVIAFLSSQMRLIRPSKSIVSFKLVFTVVCISAEQTLTEKTDCREARHSLQKVRVDTFILL